MEVHVWVTGRCAPLSVYAPVLSTVQAWLILAGNPTDSLECWPSVLAEWKLFSIVLVPRPAKGSSDQRLELRKEKRGAMTCRNHNGRLSNPVAVGRSLSRTLNIWNSDIRLLIMAADRLFDVWLSVGRITWDGSVWLLSTSAMISGQPPGSVDDLFSPVNWGSLAHILFESTFT